MTRTVFDLLSIAWFLLFPEISGRLPDNLFEHYIQEGKDVNSAPDVAIFFSRLLNKPEKDMKVKLIEHPYYSYVPYVDIDDTYQYLIGYGYKQDELARVPLILLYHR